MPPAPFETRSSPFGRFRVAPGSVSTCSRRRWGRSRGRCRSPDGAISGAGWRGGSAAFWGRSAGARGYCARASAAGWRRRLAEAGRQAALTLALAGLAAAAAAQPERLDDWVTVRSAHFELHSDAAPERALEIVDTLERFRAVFAGLAPELELRSPVPTRIFAFRDREGFDPYKTVADRPGAMILGQFLAHADGNWMTLDADPRHLGSFAVVLHEYVHYLVQGNFPRVPLWFHEGLAEYYSTFAVEGERAIVGRPVERHLRWLARNAELDLESVLSARARRGALSRPHEAGRFYAVSWGLVHYLLSAGDARDRQLADLLLGGGEQDDPVRAFEEAFGLRLRQLEDALRGYLLAPRLPVARLDLGALPALGERSLGPAAPAEVLVGLGHLLARSGREAGAERHFDLALRLGPEDAGANAGLAYLRDRQGRLEEAGVLYREALDSGSVGALDCLLYGRHLLAAAGRAAETSAERAAELAEQARRVLARGLELDPSFAEIDAELGRAHLLGAGEPQRGLRHLERAADLLPGRSDVILLLLELELRAGRPRAARRTLAGRLAPVAPPEEVARAEEAIERWTLLDGSRRAFAEGRPDEGLELFDRAVSATSDPGLRERLAERLTLLRQIHGAGR